MIISLGKLSVFMLHNLLAVSCYEAVCQKKISATKHSNNCCGEYNLVWQIICKTSDKTLIEIHVFAAIKR